MKDSKFAYFKKKVLEHLGTLEAENEKKKDGIRKSILEAESMVKGGMPVGTIREWKGKKYIKIAPGKWRPKYDGNTRGAKLSIAALKRKADKCTSSKELLQLVLENRDRFSDNNGRPLPFVTELSDYVSALNDKIETAASTEKPKKNAKKQGKGKKTVPISAKTEDKNSKTQEKAGNDNYPEYRGEEPPTMARLLFAQLNGIIEKDNKEVLENPEIGEVTVEAGKTGKHGYGLKHIIEQRYRKDGKSVDEIAALIPLICDAAMSGKTRKNGNDRVEIVKDGIMAVVSKTRNGNREQWILTGYDLFDEKEKATDTIREVISEYGYTPEFSVLRKQVGAVIDSIKQDGGKVNGAKKKYAVTIIQKRFCPKIPKGILTPLVQYRSYELYGQTQT